MFGISHPRLQVAVSRQRAALIAVCIDTFVHPDHGCTSLLALDRMLARQFIAMCDRVREKVAECHPFRAHQFFLRNWARIFYERAHPEISAALGGSSQSSSSASDKSDGGPAVVGEAGEDMLTAAEMVQSIGRRESVLYSPVVSGASPGRGPVRVKQVRERRTLLRMHQRARTHTLTHTHTHTHTHARTHTHTHMSACACAVKLMRERAMYTLSSRCTYARGGERLNSRTHKSTLWLSF
jgi:hypothetical protein